jgi:hypothetical protein
MKNTYTTEENRQGPFLGRALVFSVPNRGGGDMDDITISGEWSVTALG